MEKISDNELIISIAALGEAADLNMETIVEAIEIVSEGLTQDIRDQLEALFEGYVEAGEEMAAKYQKICEMALAKESKDSQEVNGDE